MNARGPDGQTALMQAAEEGRSEIVRVLLKHGADVNTTDEDGQTALMIAKEADHPKTVDVIEQYCIITTQRRRFTMRTRQAFSMVGKIVFIVLVIGWCVVQFAPVEEK